MEYKDFKLVFRQYAALYIVVGITDNEVRDQDLPKGWFQNSSGLEPNAVNYKSAIMKMTLAHPGETTVGGY